MTIGKSARDSGEIVRLISGVSVRFRKPLHTPDAACIGLIDSIDDAAHHPAVARLRELITERGWSGRTASGHHPT